MISRYRPPFVLSDLIKAFSPRKDSIATFEKALASYLGWKYAIIFPFGRAALWALFKSQGIIKKEVVLPSYNCRSILTPIIGLENYPVFVDSSVNHFNMSTELVEEAIKKCNNLGAVLPTSMYGLPIDLNYYQKISSKFLVVADYCLSFKPRIGTHDGIHAAIYSLGSGKQFSIQSGGVLCTDNEKIFHEVQKIKDIEIHENNNSWKKFFSGLLSLLLFHPEMYKFLYLLSENTTLLDNLKGLNIGVSAIEPPGFKRLPTPYQINVGLELLQRYHQISNYRSKVIRTYDEALRFEATDGGFWLGPQYENYSHYPIFSNRRDSLANYLIHQGIHATNIFKEPISSLPLVGYTEDEKKKFKRASEICKTLLLLPLNSKLKCHEQQRVINSIFRWNREVL